MRPALSSLVAVDMWRAAHKVSGVGGTFLRKSILVAGLVSAIAMGCASPPDGAIEELIRTAETPGDHIYLAEHYRGSAARMREQSKDHRRLADLYGDRHNREAAFATRHREHCERLAMSEEEAAMEYDMLAIAHDRAAAE